MSNPGPTRGIAGLPLDQLGRIDVKAMPRVLSRLTRLAWRYRGLCLLALGSALGAAVLSLATPHLLGRAVDQAHQLLRESARSPQAAWDALWLTGLLVIGANTLRGTLTGLQGYWGECIAHRVGYDLRLAFFEKLQRLGFGYHDVHHSGDLIARGMLDLEGVRAFLESGLLRTVVLLMLLGAGSWSLLRIDPSLAVLALSFVPFVVWRAARMGVLLRLSWQHLQRLMSDLTLTMEENLQGVRVVRAFASHRFEMLKFERHSAAALAISNARITVRMRAMSVMNLAYYISMGLVLYVGGQRIAQGLLTVGHLTEFLTFMSLLQQPVRQVGMIVNSSARAASAGARLFEVLDTTPTIRDAPGAPNLALRRGVLRFEDVHFAYPTPKGPHTVLAGISFEVGPGQTLGIVGPPGSGKSTLAHLIPRFYDVTGGRITIDGQDIRGVTLASLRQTVGLVQQEVFLFDTSVHENMAYADPLTEPERVEVAAGVAQIHDHVSRMPGGYGTRVGERGVALSGGQRQRMSIARGLVPEPAIIVLDDATAAVDAATEQRVRAALRGALGNMATLVISHRLSSLQHGDEIIVLDDHRIAERGTHAALLSAGGLYARLWALQNAHEGGGHETPPTTRTPPRTRAAAQDTAVAP